ncbi:MAG: (2Fe-2S)-binding protein [Pseudolabrys sp.]
MIVCSCNVLSEAQILESLKGDASGRPRSAGDAYRCLGCAPRCGRCVQTVRALAERAHLENCAVGCPACPAHREAAHAEPAEMPYLIAAE